MKYVLHGGLWVPHAWGARQKQREELKARMLDAIRKSNEPEQATGNGIPFSGDIRVLLDGIRKRPVR